MSQDNEYYEDEDLDLVSDKQRKAIIMSDQPNEV